MPRFDVTIAGELNLDLILYGLPEQLLPERSSMVFPNNSPRSASCSPIA
jgi:hypothetical protein